MWFTLALATLTCLIVLYVPGFLLGRALTLGRFSALVIAPVFSVCGFTIMGVVFYRAGVTLPGWALALIVAAIALAAFGISKLACYNRLQVGDCLIRLEDDREAWRTAVLYILVALVVTFLVFIVSIHTPDGFCRRDDNTVHLSLIRGFLDTGTFSTLDVSVYLDQGGNKEFYPAAWHVLVAIVASLFGDGVALATNAAIIACVAVVFPLAMCLLLLRIFPDRRLVVLSGCLFPAAFCGFPWGFLVRGQLCPNMLSFMFVPLAFVLLMELVNVSGVRKRVCLAFGFLIALIGIALAHPNGAFVFGIWAVLWGVTRFFYAPGKDRAQVAPGRIVCAVLLFVCACGVWYMLFKMPQLQSTVAYGTLPRASWPKELAAGLLFRFSNQEGIQPVLTIFTLAGIIYTLRNRKLLWLTVAYLAALMFFVIDASTEGFVKQLLTGFWYSDATRTGAVAALYAIPLVALGFAWIWEFASGLILRRGRPDVSPQDDLRRGRPDVSPQDDLRRGRPAVGPRVEQSSTPAKENSQAARSSTPAKGSPQDAPRSRIVASVLVAVLAISQFMPFHMESGGKSVDLGLEKIRSEVNFFYSWNSGLTAEEHEFVEQVMEVIPEGAMVINVPSDGSCWSYGVEGLNTYFRRSTNRGLGGITKSKVLRTRLKDVATDVEVRDILNEYGAKYLLILDDMRGENRTTVDMRYEEKNWTGIETVTEETPGFTLVLSEGDMRLYEIDAMDE